MKVYVLTHEYDNGRQIEVFDKKKKALNFQKDILKQYSEDLKETIKTVEDLNHFENDSWVSIEEIEVR